MQEEKVIFEYYKNRKIEKKQHKINSCTKSVLSAFHGNAFDQGYFKDVHLPVSDFFQS
ncbi:hypothetical protein RZN25_14735 [Bacillaceae bacterium S4-13-56]